jgi:hypothetical protein
VDGAEDKGGQSPLHFGTVHQERVLIRLCRALDYIENPNEDDLEAEQQRQQLGSDVHQQAHAEQ